MHWEVLWSASSNNYNFVCIIIARTCSDAGKQAGCCESMEFNSVMICSWRCYCDRLCAKFSDCCKDVSSAVNYHYCGKLAQPIATCITCTIKENTKINVMYTHIRVQILLLRVTFKLNYYYHGGAWAIS